MSQTPVHTLEWGTVGQAQRCKARPLQRAPSLWSPCHIISVSEGAAAEWINYRVLLGSGGSVAPAFPLFCSAKGFQLGWLMLHWEAMWIGFSRLFLFTALFMQVSWSLMNEKMGIWSDQSWQVYILINHLTNLPNAAAAEAVCYSKQASWQYTQSIFLIGCIKLENNFIHVARH